MSEWHRIWIGKAPTAFLLEVFLRTVVSYSALLIAMKGLGKRMAGQLTVIEMAVMTMLGPIVSVAMQQATHGLLPGLFVLLLAVAFQRDLGRLEFWSPVSKR